MMIRNLIRRIFSTSAVRDTNTYQTVQGEIFDQARNVSVVTPYGLLSSCPNGGDGVVWQLMGQEDNLVALLSDPVNRKKNLKEGESGIENTKTGVYLLLKEDGTIEVEINGSTLDINGVVNAIGDINSASDVNATGNVDGGTYSVSGTPGASGTFISADGVPKTVTVLDGIITSIV